MKSNKNIILLFAFKFLNYFYMIDLVHTVYMNTKGINMLHIGMIFSVYQLSKIIFELPTGIVADKFGRKISTICSFIFLILGNLMVLLGQGYIFFVSASILQGIAYTFFSGASDALFIDTVLEKTDKNNLSKYLSAGRMTAYTAIFCSATLAGFLWKYFDISIIYKLTIAIEVIAIVVVSFIDEPKSFDKNNKNKVTAMNGWLELKNSKIAFLIASIDVFTAFAMIPMEKHYGSYLKTYNLPEQFIGFSNGLQYVIAGVVGFFLLNLIIKYLNRAKIFIWGSIFIPFCTVLFTIIPFPYLKVIMYLLHILIVCFVNPIKDEYFHTNISSDLRATILSIISIGMSVVALIAYLLSGTLIDNISYSFGLATISIISFIGITISVLFLKKEIL